MNARGRGAARGVRVEARAKLNLALHIGPRRSDGFHELATVFQSISLSDTLRIVPRRRGFGLRVRHEEAAVRGRTPRDPVPAGRSNLVLRAARALAEATGLEAGAGFTLIKRVPSGSGLGGGSADAAAAIAGLARLYRLRVPKPRLLEIAASVGSDVPFALTGGTALGFGRGERLVPLRLRRPFRALVAVPRWRVSTALAYARIARQKNRLTRWRSNLNSVQRLGRKHLSAEVALRLGNDLEGVLASRRSDFHSLCARLRDSGVAEIRMTGSGSAVFGVLGPGAPAGKILERFDGIETIYLVRSARNALKISRMP